MNTGSDSGATRASGGDGGFTLVETLVAMSLVCAILLPSSFWLYQSRAGGAATERFRASQLLEMRMNRALLLRQAKDGGEEIPGPDYLRLVIRVVRDGAEVRLMGTALDRKGHVQAQLQAGYFAGKP